jgi:hypothetical protein
MIILALLITPDLENHGAETPAAPADSAELLRIISLLVEQVCLVEDFLRVFQADAVFLLDIRGPPNNLGSMISS